MTRTLIALNLGVFVLMALLENANPDLAQKLGQWGAVGRTLSLNGEYLHQFGIWQLITSAFLHGGFMHIFGNMIFLLVFGPPVEDRFGRIGYTLFYLAGASGSALAHIGVEQAPAIGASGAVAAVSGAFLVLFPRTHIKCFVFFIFIGVFMIPSWWLIGLYIVLDLFSQVLSANNGIANMAHLGGYGFGIFIALFLLGTKVLKREQYDLLSIIKHKNRKRAFASAHKIQTNSMGRVMHDPRADDPDPKALHMANARAEIGKLLNEERLDEGADAYLRLIDEFGHDEQAPLTLHRDAQYQVANTLYQRGERVRACDAFSRLLASYPADPERQMITILIARTRADDQGDVPGAITMLEELAAQGLNDETKAIVTGELERIKAQHSQSDEEQQA